MFWTWGHDPMLPTVDKDNQSVIVDVKASLFPSTIGVKLSLKISMMQIIAVVVLK